MKIGYEGVDFLVSFSSSIERSLIKLKLKKSFGVFLEKPYYKDSYLSLGEKILNQTLSPVVIDIGANIGTTVLPLAKRFPRGQFIAVEPHPLPAARFIQNCQMNNLSNIFLVNAAIAPEEGLGRIYTCPSNSGGHRVTGFEGRENFIRLSSLEHISVPLLSLKKLFSHFNIQHCDLLKIDVEGFEGQVLESLEDLLVPSNVGVVVAEYGPEGMEKAGRTGWSLVKMMLEKGFRCRELKSNKNISCEGDIPSLPDYTVTDLVFCSPSSTFF